MKETDAWPWPGVAETPVGAPPAPRALTGLEGLDAGPVPMAFVAVTVNVYVSPLVSPFTLMGLVVPVPVSPPWPLLVVSWPSLCTR